MTTVRVRTRWLLCGVVAMSAAACGQDVRDGAPEGAAELSGGEVPTPSTAMPVVSDELPFDLEAAIEDAKLTFRTDGAGGFVTRQATHSIQARDGALTFSPSSYVASARRVLHARPLEIETVSITRDEGDLSQGLGTTQADYGNSIRIDRGVAVERIENSPTGIEQTWSFDHPPLGSGPLVVRVAVSGQRYVGVDERGHHFVDEATGVGTAYSHATWVDLTGQRTAVPVVFDGESGELVMAVTAETLAASTYPAVLDPTVSAEAGTTGAAITLSAGFEETPQVAFDGTRYLVVWSDSRDGDSYDIWGTFINTAGVVQNTSGLLIGTAAGTQRLPALAFNGTHYLVVWEDHRRATATVPASDIIGRRVDTAGNLVGNEIALSVTGLAGAPDVTAMGTTWMVVWEDFVGGGNSNVLFSSVLADGTASDPLAFNDQPSNEARPAVACGATACMAVFSAGLNQGEDIYRQRFDINGLIDVVSSTISGPTNGRSLLPDIAFDGTNYAVVWQDRRTGSTDIYGQRVVAATGANLDGTGFAITNIQDSDQFAPSIAWDGTRYLVAWHDARSAATLGTDIIGTLLQTNGTITNPAGLAINRQAQGQRYPRLVAGGGQFFAVWEDDRLGPPLNIRGARITTTGAVPDVAGISVATAANRQTAAAIANASPASNNYLLVFNDTRLNGASNYDLVAIRISIAGASLDPGGLSLAGGVGNQIGPEISSNGTSFLVVWQDGRSGATVNSNYDIYGAVVTVNAQGFGNPSVGTNGFPISTAAGHQLAPTLAWNAGANSWLVAWGDQRTSVNTDLYAARVGVTGVVADPNGIVISAAADVQQRPAVASDGTNWLVAWTDRSSGVANSENVLGSIVTGAGTAGAPFSISSAANRQEAVRVAHSGVSYVATWQDNRLQAVNTNIIAARISNAGVVQDVNGVSIANSLTLSEVRPRVVRMGNNLFFVWSVQTNSTSTQYDLAGRQFTSALVPVAAAFTISNLTGSESQAAVAADFTNNAAVVAYQRYDATLGIRAERVRFRRVTFP